MTRTRFLTGSLATLAVASAVTLSTPAAFADEVAARSCGQSFIAAVYQSVEHPAVFRTVPATSHLEWRWTRVVTTTELEYTLAEAYTVTDWTRQVPGATEFQWSRTVITQPFVAAVPGTPAVTHTETVVDPAVTGPLWTWIQRNGNTKREPEDWGAGNGEGWEIVPGSNVIVPASSHEITVVDRPAIAGTDAIDEVSHPEYTWAIASPGADWTATGAEQAGPATTENITTGGAEPAGDGWTQTGSTDFPAETRWAATVLEGYTATGNSRIASTSIQTTDATSADAPTGTGWDTLADSESIVEDSAERVELVTPGSTEQVLVSPEVPASAACVSGPGATSEVAPAQAAAAQSVASVLPNTGNGAPAWMVAAGFGALLTGAGLVGSSRKGRHAAR